MSSDPRRCPSCGARLDGHPTACPVCGLGLPTVASAPSLVSLAVGWMLTSATVLAPWLVLGTHGISDGAYFLGFGVYLLVANLFTPRYDAGDLGWFDGRMDNPFSLSDDWNRGMRSLGFLLFPGKMVVWTLRSTWATIVWVTRGS